MRILFTYVGGRGHLLPLLPLARAAAADGHQVAVAGSSRPLVLLDGHGMETFSTSDPAQPGPSSVARQRDLTPLEPADGRAAEIEFATNFAARGARRHARAIGEIIPRWRPDVVVRDETDFGAGIAAERHGLPCAVLLVLAAGTLQRPDLVAPELDRVRREHGLAPMGPEVDLLAGDLVLSPFPPGLHHPDAPLPGRTLFFRSGRAGLQARGDATEPTVYFTLGTIFNTASGDLFERALAGLGAVRAEVVATVGSEIDPDDLPARPAHVDVRRFVDQAVLLPRCDLVVSHGGSGSLLGALSHGLPSLLLPLGADQTHNAERVEALGVGVSLDAASVTPRQVTEAVERLLTDPGPRERALDVRREIESLPDLPVALEGVERLGRR